MKRNKKIVKRLLGLFLCLTILLSYVPEVSLTVMAADDTKCVKSDCNGTYVNGFCDKCDGYQPATEVYGVYEIANAGQLYWFADQMNRAPFRCQATLVNDITINENVLNEKGELVNASQLRMWIPIGTNATHSFEGSFDGNNYTISGLYCDMEHAGLFQNIVNSTICNLYIKDSYFNGAYAAAIAVTEVNSAVERCFSNATVLASERAGGIVCQAWDSGIYQCGASGRTILSGTAKLSGIGGILGSATKLYTFTNVSRCYYNGMLEYANGDYTPGKEQEGHRAGALVGAMLYASLSDSVYLDTLPKANGEIWDDTKGTYEEGTEYELDENTIFAKGADAFADGTVCSLIGTHPLMENAYPERDMECLLCAESRSRHIPVADIEGRMPAIVSAGEYDLPGTIIPANASKKQIVWSVTGGNATISDNKLKVTGAGNLVLRGTIANGGYRGEDFVKEYDILSVEQDAFDIGDGPLFITKRSDTQIQITQKRTTGDYQVFQGKDQPVRIKGQGKNDLWVETTYLESTVTVEDGVSVTLILEDCTIDSQRGENKASISLLKNSSTKIILAGNNKISSSSGSGCGIYVDKDASVEFSGSGLLEVSTNAYYCAAIGGWGSLDSNGQNNGTPDSGKITISEGTIIASASGRGAAIGGGLCGTNGAINITGGNVTAKGGGFAARIGAGDQGAAGPITITGGKVKAVSQGSDVNGAAIGAAHMGDSGSIEIRGGVVEAINESTTYGYGIDGALVITGGNVKTNSIDGIPVDGSGNALTLFACTVAGVTDGTQIREIEGVTYGLGDVKTLADKLYLYLPESTKLTSMTANGVKYVDAEGDLIFCNHASYEWKVLVESTCTKQGINVYQCPVCGYHPDAYESVLAPGPYPEKSFDDTAYETDTQIYSVEDATKLTVKFAESTQIVYQSSLEVRDANGKLIKRYDMFSSPGGETLEIPGNYFSIQLISNTYNYNGYEIEAIYAVVPSAGDHVRRLPLAEHNYVEGKCSMCGLPEHTHVWGYAVEEDNNSIQAECTAENCPTPNGGSVTLSAPADLSYSGSSKDAELTYKDWLLGEEAKPAVTYNATNRVNMTGEDITATIVLGEAAVAVTYQVEKASLEGAGVTVGGTYIYDGTTKEPADITVTWNGVALTKDTDYTVSYSNNTDVGTATVTVQGIGNYTGVATGTFKIEYLNNAPDASVSGTEGANGWYTSAVTLMPPEGYTIAQTLGGEYNASPVIVSGEMNGILTYYLKDADGQIAEKQVDLKIDLNNPTAEYQIDVNDWKKFVNTISFGLFSKDYKTINIDYKDDFSGLASKQYFIASEEITDAAQIAWLDYIGTLYLNETGTYFIYVRVEDNAGRTVVFNSEGIVIYADSEKDTESVSLVFKEGENQSISVKLNGNTVKEVKNGNAMLTAGNDYSMSGNVITLNAGYLDTLAAGTYTFTVSYNPQGVETSEITMETTFEVVVEKANVSILNKPVAVDGLIYNGDAQALITGGTVQNGEMQYSLDGENYSTNIPKKTKAGKYTVYYKVVGDANYKDTEPQTVEVSIAKKTVTATATAPDKVYGESVDVDPSKIMITLDGILEGDEVETIVKEAWYHAHHVTDSARVPVVYNVAGDDAGNYAFTEMGDYIAPDYYVEATAAITPRELTVDVVVADKQYDGLNKATITSATLNNVLAGDEITLVNGVATFESVEVAENIGINFTDFTLSGEDSVLKNYTLKQPEGVTSNIVNDWTPIEYTFTGLNVNYYINTDFVVTAADGYSISLTNTAEGIWSDKLVESTETNNGSITFYLKNNATGEISLEKTMTYRIDKTPAIGKVYFDGRNGWETFLNTISFGLFFKNEVTVKAEVTDALSGVESMEYASADKAMDLAEVKAIDQWTAMPEQGVAVTVEDAKKFVCFVRITDKAGNVCYLSTDGAEYDTTAPVISGIENNKTYYTTQEVLVSDKNLASVTLNEQAIADAITLAGDKDVTYTIVATDKAGNTTTVTVTMKQISTLSDSIKDITTSNVSADDAAAIAVVEEALQEVDTAGATAEEKESLKAALEKVDTLQKVIEDTAEEVKALEDKLAGYDKDTVTSDDQNEVNALEEELQEKLKDTNLSQEQKADLEKALEDAKELASQIAKDKENFEAAQDVVVNIDTDKVTADDADALAEEKEKLEAIVDSNNRNYTDAEKEAAHDVLDKIEELEKVIEDTEAEVKDIESEADALDADTVTSKDKESVEQFIDKMEEKLSDANLTEAQKDRIEAVIDIAEGIVEKIEIDQKVLEDALAAKKDTTSDNYVVTDKTDLEDAIKELEKVVAEGNANYTAEEKQKAQSEINRIQSVVEQIKQIEAAEDTICDIVDKVDAVQDVVIVPDSKELADAVINAYEIYNKLDDRQKLLLDQEFVDSLERVLVKVTAYKVIKGADGKYIKESANGLSFTANGAFGFFKAVKINGSVLDAKHYTAKAGSTVVELTTNYLNSIDAGNHTFEVVYEVLGKEYGAATKFVVENAPEEADDVITNEYASNEGTASGETTPNTGDNTNVFGWMSAMFASILALAVVLKKKKQMTTKW